MFSILGVKQVYFNYLDFNILCLQSSSDSKREIADGSRWLTVIWLIFFALSCSMVAFSVCFGSLSICTAKCLSVCQFCSIGLNLSRKHSSSVKFTIHTSQYNSSSSIHLSDLVPLAAMQTHAILLQLPCLTEDVSN